MAAEWGVSPLEIDREMTTREMWMFMNRIQERHKRRSKAARGQAEDDGPLTKESLIARLQAGSS